MKPPARKKWLWHDGKGNWYVRRKGRYFPIKAPEGSAEFDLAYWAIINGKAAPARTSWAALIAAFRLSDRWAGLKPRTRADYGAVLDYIETTNGAADCARATRRDVLAAMEANRHRVRFGNYVKQVLSVLFEYAIDLGWRKDNPAKGARSLKVPADRQKAHVPWTDEAVAKWRSEAAPLPRLIFELGVGTVQRPTDLTRFRWGDWQGASLALVQGKTGVSLRLPCTVELQAQLEAWRPATYDPAAPILRAVTGGAMSYRYLAAVMLAERKRLQLERHDLHALRYRGAQELAWAGCSDEEIASFSGHASAAMVRKYAGEARQVMRARQAATKRENG